MPSRPTAFRGIIEVVVRDYTRHESNEDNGKEEDGGTKARSRVGPRVCTSLPEMAGSGFGPPVRAASATATRARVVREVFNLSIAVAVG